MLERIQSRLVPLEPSGFALTKAPSCHTMNLRLGCTSVHPFRCTVYSVQVYIRKSRRHARSGHFSQLFLTKSVHHYGMDSKKR